MNTGKVVLGTLTGFVIGAIAGVLLAPDKGSTTRKQIMDKGDNYITGLKSKFDEFFDSLLEQLENTKKDVQDIADKGKPDEAKNLASSIKHPIS